MALPFLPEAGILHILTASHTNTSESWWPCPFYQKLVSYPFSCVSVTAPPPRLFGNLYSTWRTPGIPGRCGLLPAGPSTCCPWEPLYQWPYHQILKTQLTNCSFRSHRPLQKATKSEKVMINNNLVWFLFVSFFWLSIQKNSFNIEFENKHSSANTILDEVFLLFSQSLMKHLHECKRDSEVAIATQASFQKIIVIESHQSCYNCLNYTNFNTRALRSHITKLKNHCLPSFNKRQLVERNRTKLYSV